MLQPQFIILRSQEGHEYINLAEVVTAVFTRQAATITLRDGSTRQVSGHESLKQIDIMFRRLSHPPPAQPQ